MKINLFYDISGVILKKNKPSNKSGAMVAAAVARHTGGCEQVGILRGGGH